MPFGKIVGALTHKTGPCLSAAKSQAAQLTLCEAYRQVRANASNWAPIYSPGFCFGILLRGASSRADFSHTFSAGWRLQSMLQARAMGRRRTGFAAFRTGYCSSRGSRRCKRRQPLLLGATAWDCSIQAAFAPMNGYRIFPALGLMFAVSASPVVGAISFNQLVVHASSCSNFVQQLMLPQPSGPAAARSTDSGRAYPQLSPGIDLCFRAAPPSDLPDTAFDSHGRKDGCPSECTPVHSAKCPQRTSTVTRRPPPAG